MKKKIKDAAIRFVFNHFSTPEDNISLQYGDKQENGDRLAHCEEKKFNGLTFYNYKLIEVQNGRNVVVEEGYDFCAQKDLVARRKQYGSKMSQWMETGPRGPKAGKTN